MKNKTKSKEGNKIEKIKELKTVNMVIDNELVKFLSAESGRELGDKINEIIDRLNKPK